MRLLLSVLYQASIGATASQLQQKTYFSDRDENNILLKSEIQRVFASPNVKLANKVFVKEDGIINESFKSLVKGYKSEIQNVDFSKANDVANTINQWVETHTNGLIKNLVDPSTINADTALYLVNALYFKAKWLDPFPGGSVYDRPFTSIDDTVRSIPFMTQYGGYRQASIDKLGAFALEIPYETESNFVFWILLPNAESPVLRSFTQLAKFIKTESIAEIASKLEQRYCILNLPLFEISTEVDLKTTLSTLGLTALFNQGELDILNNTPPLKVTDGKQKNKIIVNTEGTEAASTNCKNILIDKTDLTFNFKYLFYFRLCCNSHVHNS